MFTTRNRSLITPGTLLVLLVLLVPSIAGASTAAVAPDRSGSWGDSQSLSSTPVFIHLAIGSFDPLQPTATIDSLVPDEASDLILERYPGDGLGYYIVQFDGPITELREAALTNEGAQLYDYIPDYAFVVRMDHQTLDRVRQVAGVRWVGLYQPAYRVTAALLGRSGKLGGLQELEVLTFPGEREHIAAQIRAMGAEVLHQSETQRRGQLRVRVDGDKIGEIVSLAGVRWVSDPPQWKLFNNPATDLMDARDVWDTHGLYGAGQIVAVCDTGLDGGSTFPISLHDDFEDGSGTSRVSALFDLVGDGGSDVNSGHGTHVAGSVLGNGYGSGATPSTHTYPSISYAGLAPEANLIFQAVERNAVDGDLSGIPNDLFDLFAQADMAGAHIHTNSWGAAVSGEYTPDSEAVDEYIWSHKDFTILFAAGNEASDADRNGVVDPGAVTAPGTAKNAITVGASENNRPTVPYRFSYGQAWLDDFPVNPIYGDEVSDDPIGIAAFSGRGPTNDGRYKPDIVAPGTFIASVRSSQALPDENWGWISDRYVYMGGTSMSTPLTAGATALVRQFYTDREGHVPSAALIKATLISGATSLSPGQYGTGGTQEIPDLPSPNNVEGWGRVNVENSLFSASPREIFYVDNTTGLATGQEATFQYKVLASTEPLRVTLVWTDYPATPAADGALVNNLDLTAIGPSSTVYYPIGAQQRTAGETVSALADNVNNVEGIRIANPAPGVYTIRVRAANIPHGPQPFALVVSGAVTDELEEDLTVTAIGPDRALNNGLLNATVSGNGFGPASQVALVKGSQVVAGSVTSVDASGDSMAASFDLSAVQPGEWDVRVTNPDVEPAVLAKGLLVLDASLPDLQVAKQTSQSRADPGGLLTYTISQHNDGLVDATQVVFTDTLPQDLTFVRLSPACMGGTLMLADGFACRVEGSTITGGGSAVYVLVASISPDAAGTVTNAVEVAGARDDRYSLDNSDAVAVWVGDATIYLPYLARLKMPVPVAPTLNPISNPEADGSYTVNWTAAAGATGYTLQEANDTTFTGASVVYSGPNLSASITGRGPGSYYYRVRGTNSAGAGAWSNPESVAVQQTLPEVLNATEDSDVLEALPNSNSGDLVEMWVGYDEWEQTNYRTVRGFAKFDLSAIPAGTSISQATLYLFLNSSYDYPNKSRLITVYRVGSPWSELTLTWNSQPTTQEAYGSTYVKHGDWRWYAFNVAGLVQGWVNGTWANHGLAVRGPEQAGLDSSWKAFFTREQEGYAPYIQLVYTAQGMGDVNEPVEAETVPIASGDEQAREKVLERFHGE